MRMPFEHLVQLCRLQIAVAVAAKFMLGIYDLSFATPGLIGARTASSCAENLLHCTLVHACVVRLHVHALYLAAINKQSVALRADVAKKCRSVEAEVKSVSERTGRVGKEVDLRDMR